MEAGFDFYRFDDSLNPDQRRIRDRMRAWVEERLKPVIAGYWERAEFPRELVGGLRDLNIMGGVLQGHGCAGLDSLSAGLVAAELARGDASVATFYGIHSGLAMGSIGLLGSNAQQARWLPGMAALERIGAFGLTEPERGSDAAHVLTRARRQGDEYVLDGTKRWIGNASIADVLVVWARDEEDKLGGFVVEDPGQTPGLTMEDITGKSAMRALSNAHIELDGVRVPAAHRLAHSRSFRDTARVLAFSRYSVSWFALGLATACFERALDYSRSRQQFGRPIAAFQLIQQKLVDMAGELTLMQGLGLQLARLLAAGSMTEGQVALAKYNNAGKARRIAGLAREIMGGEGILLDNEVARHLADVEGVYTYEGTNEINLLVAGREITGVNAIV